MFDIKLLALLAPLLLGFGALNVADAGGTDPLADVIASADTETAAEPFACEIRKSSSGGMTTLEGVVMADDALSGEYRFHVTSSGRAGGTNIQQGGGFTVRSGEEVTLGRVMLGGSAAGYDASLTVTADGTTVECTDDRGGII